MSRSIVLLGILGALLGGAPPISAQNRAALDPRIDRGTLHWFQLDETKDEIARVLGLPHLSVDFGADFHSWQYRDRDSDHDEFSASLVFRRSTGRLVALTRSFAEERNVDAFFPDGETRTYCRAANTGPDYCVRVRRLSGGRILLAGGVSRRGQATTQLVLIRETELSAFFPWLSLEPLTRPR